MVSDCVGNGYSILAHVLCSADFVEGFSVFKGLADNNAELRSEKVDMRKDDDSVAVRRRKEIEREFEVIEILQLICVVYYMTSKIQFRSLNLSQYVNPVH